MNFEWDPGKNSSNVNKHGVSFEKAQEVFEDPLHLSLLDERFSYFEERWITMGQARDGEVLIVAHFYSIEHEVERIRIISARRATKIERKQYEEIE